MKNTSSEQENVEREISLLTLVSIIVAAFGATFGVMAAVYSFLRSGEMPWVTLVASMVCLVVAGSVFLVEKTQS